ncbi:hypothetical protein PR048_004626 [Dryococelus australis]|uniref:Transposase n=1 Tax=Dryococelus australis TaxID=614101 RepID=A0ABQ9I6R1_9NEOP|nr:hypothetical protein PR048_004626 [Dryococelus australis]
MCSSNISNGGERRRIERCWSAFGAGKLGGRGNHNRMSAVHGEHCMSRSCVLEWYKRFREMHVILQVHARTGKTYHTVTTNVIARMVILLGIPTGHCEINSSAISKSLRPLGSTSSDGVYSFLSHIVSEDETWCRHFKSERNWLSHQLIHVSFPPAENIQSRAYKLRESHDFFFDCKCPLLVDFFEIGPQSMHKAMMTLCKI